MRKANSPKAAQMNSKKIIGKEFYPFSAVDKGKPENPQNLEVQKKGSRKRNKKSNYIGTPGFGKATKALRCQNEEKQPKRKIVKQPKRNSVKSSNQQGGCRKRQKMDAIKVFPTTQVNRDLFKVLPTTQVNKDLFSNY